MEGELVNAFYGLLRLGVMCALKYMYPSMKKFFVRKIEKKNASFFPNSGNKSC
jgi:hypothetical protein